jgi:1-acyl-sn-glycerol-3-phosphate acyltransferase
MKLQAVKLALYSLWLTNYYGIKLKMAKEPAKKRQIRLEYAKTLLAKLQIDIDVKNISKLPSDGKFLLVSNHRGIIDPLVVEMALQNSNIYGLWVSKKELYNSFFFGLFVRNGGSILLDREQSQMSGFFADVKREVKSGNSIFIFPEGTRNKSDMPLIEFKEGSRIIALKNRLPILPLYIKTRTDKALNNSLNDKNIKQTVVVEIGDIIDYKQKANLQDIYKDMFNIE